MKSLIKLVKIFLISAIFLVPTFVLAGKYEDFVDFAGEEFFVHPVALEQYENDIELLSNDEIRQLENGLIRQFDPSEDGGDSFHDLIDNELDSIIRDRSITVPGEVAPERKVLPPSSPESRRESRRENGLVGFFSKLTDIVAKFIPIMIGLALLVFLWGITRYAFSTNETTRREAVYIITYGIIALFVMVSVWGLVNMLGSSLNISTQDNNKIDYGRIDVNSLPPR
jgi:hypothetical protein